MFNKSYNKGSANTTEIKKKKSTVHVHLRVEILKYKVFRKRDAEIK